MKLRFLLPLILFALLVILLWHGLSLHPNHIPSPLINKPAPTFELPTLYDFKKTTSNKDFIGHITVLNVWATWCTACADEHNLLVELSKEKDFVLYGINYKDDPAAAKDWLEKYGNPYKIVAVDPNGQVAIDWGVYGTPETFIIDKKGVVRYKQLGSITPEIWEEDIKPVIQQLRDEK